MKFPYHFKQQEMVQKECKRKLMNKSQTIKRITS